MSDNANEDDKSRPAGAHAAEPDDSRSFDPFSSRDQAPGTQPGGEPYPDLPYVGQPPIVDQPPQFTDQAQFTDETQFTDQPTRFGQSPPYLEQPQFAAPPHFVAQAPTSYTDPPQYVRQPPQFVEKSPVFGDHAAAYAEPPPPYAEPPYGEQHPPAYGAQPPSYGEQHGYSAPSSDPQASAPGPQDPPFEHTGPGPAAPVPGHGYGPPALAPIPRPEDLLVPSTSNIAAEPASWGWRGKLNRGSGGLIKAKAAEVELSARRAIVGIQRSFSRPMTVVVIQPKGGGGKTPTTICLSAAFGAHRGGYVVGWDDNETRGTLAVRVANPDNQRATVWDLLSDLPAFERFDARVGDLSYYVRAQPDAHFDALVSDDNPGNMAQIGEDEFQRLHHVLQRFYRMIVVDTGNNVRSANWQAAVNSADLVVVVSTYQRDVGFSASWVLDHLAQTGREDLARNAVSILTAAEPTSDKAVREQLLNHFAARTRAVVQVPYDKELAHGGPINWTALAPQTRTAWVQAGATIADALAEQDERTLAERRA
ncbi:MAG: chromosome partitioning protein [Actinomycetota bacterium]|nr:chromosome partitioning protein [Actinomycetota bacterium]